MKNIFTSISITLLFVCLFCAQITLAQKKEFDGIYKEGGKFGIIIKKKGASILLTKAKYDSLMLGTGVLQRIYFYKKKTNGVYYI